MLLRRAGLTASAGLSCAYCYRRYRSVVCLSVTFVHCAQTAEDIANIFLYNNPIFLLDRVEIWLTSVNPFLPRFWPKVTYPLLT